MSYGNVSGQPGPSGIGRGHNNPSPQNMPSTVFNRTVQALENAKPYAASNAWDVYSHSRSGKRDSSAIQNLLNLNPKHLSKDISYLRPDVDRVPKNHAPRTDQREKIFLSGGTPADWAKQVNCLLPENGEAIVTLVGDKNQKSLWDKKQLVPAERSMVVRGRYIAAPVLDEAVVANIALGIAGIKMLGGNPTLKEAMSNTSLIKDEVRLILNALFTPEEHERVRLSGLIDQLRERGDYPLNIVKSENERIETLEKWFDVAKHQFKNVTHVVVDPLTTLDNVEYGQADDLTSERKPVSVGSDFKNAWANKFSRQSSKGSATTPRHVPKLSQQNATKPVDSQTPSTSRTDPTWTATGLDAYIAAKSLSPAGSSDTSSGYVMDGHEEQALQCALERSTQDTTYEENLKKAIELSEMQFNDDFTTVKREKSVEGVKKQASNGARSSGDKSRASGAVLTLRTQAKANKQEHLLNAQNNGMSIMQKLALEQKAQKFTVKTQAAQMAQPQEVTDAIASIDAALREDPIIVSTLVESLSPEHQNLVKTHFKDNDVFQLILG